MGNTCDIYMQAQILKGGLSAERWTAQELEFGKG